MVTNAAGGKMRCSCKRSAALICSINLLAAFYVLHLILSSLVARPPQSVSTARRYEVMNRNGIPMDSRTRFTAGVIERLKEAAEARRAVEPVELMKRVREMRLESAGVVTDSTEASRQKVAEEVSQKLQEFKGNYVQPEDWHAVEQQRRAGFDILRPDDAEPNPEKLGDVQLEGGKLVLRGPETEDGIIPGRPVPEVCNAEPHTDYDGLAVRWGLNHPQESAADCCQACLDQARTASKDSMKCNVWVYCPAEEGCFSPDLYEHKQFECWLKQAENPNVNFKGRYSPDYRREHPACPQVVPWVSGVLDST